MPGCCFETGLARIPIGYRQYICVPHDLNRDCPHPEDFFKGKVTSGLDLVESRDGIARLLNVLDELEAQEHLEATTVRTIIEGVQRLLRSTETDALVREEVDYQLWLEAFGDLSQLVIDPPWALRKRFRVPEGPLTKFDWITEVARKLERHRTCCNVLYLDAHG